MESVDCIPSPDTVDPTTPTISDTGVTPALSLDSSQNPTPRLQGVKNTGGIDETLRVVQCTNVDLSLDYEGLYAIMKGFGNVERLKLVLSPDKASFTLYSTFFSSVCAREAHVRLNGHNVNGRSVVTKLFSYSNIRDDDSDYIPADFDTAVSKKTAKDPPNLLWHVATFKEGKDNMIKAAECIQRKVGKIPEENMKRYGNGILLKARNDTQAALLFNFNPPDSSNILQMSPHKSFNTQRAMIYSRDLYAYSEEEILDMCPSNVCEVRKLKGSNNAIMLVLTSRFHMDSICFNHIRIKVKKYKLNPTQCRSCFEYGHIASRCSLSPRCNNCSGLHQSDNCNKSKFCFQCSGAHSPTDKRCPRYKFEQEIRETVHTNHVSVGEAKKLVLNANKSPTSTFSSVLQGLKSSKNDRGAATNKASLRSQPNLLSNAPNLSLSESITSVPPRIVPALIPSSSSDHQVLSTNSYPVGLDHPPGKNRSSTDTKSISEPQNSEKQANQDCSAMPPSKSTVACTTIPTSNRFDLLRDNHDHMDECNDVDDEESVMEEVQGTMPHLNNKRSRESFSPPKSKKKSHTSPTHSVESDSTLSLEVTPSPVLETKDVVSFALQLPDVHIVENPAPVADLASPPEISGPIPALSQEEISPSPVIGRLKGKLIDPQFTSNMKHNSKCGCHRCFQDVVQKQEGSLNITKLSAIIESFIKYRQHNVLGNLDDHPIDCMCVDHLNRKRKTESLNVSTYLENLKVKQADKLSKKSSSSTMIRVDYQKLNRNSSASADNLLLLT